MKRRPRRSTPATLTALVLLGGCTVVAVAAIQLILGQRPWLDYGVLHRIHWNELPVAVSGGVLVLSGLTLVLAAVLPGRLTILPLRGETDSGASRRSYRSTLRSAAAGVDGVSRAKLTLRRRRVAAKVRTERTNPTGLAEAVRAAIEQRVAQIDPAVQPRISVKVARRSN
ncbi:DUF6286 domain-containing protein [Amycolatopsis albispora]|uniref:DUF6286 domain-containing protein n=1 Tax=Amycolatopsis albispora TaxID=1804986 RepID=A0A344L6N8_9PSEU|nr:DUF6286 domain-containing protein [Amycolatopsis albispora]AXB43712.1 hypothetical protein A4R43_15225 [Amycolatopsis albispora]